VDLLQQLDVSGSFRSCRTALYVNRGKRWDESQKLTLVDAVQLSVALSQLQPGGMDAFQGQPMLQATLGRGRLSQSRSVA
jgi:hypothetical protein